MKTRKIKVVVLVQPNAPKNKGCIEKIYNADIVIRKNKSGYEVIKNKLENVFEPWVNIDDFKNNNKYIVEEFEYEGN